MARDQRLLLLRQRTTADHAVHVLGHKVDHAIADAEIEPDFRVTIHERGQCRDDEHARDGAARVHAQPTLRACLSVRYAGLDVIEVAE